MNGGHPSRHQQNISEASAFDRPEQSPCSLGQFRTVGLIREIWSLLSRFRPDNETWESTQSFGRLSIPGCGERKFRTEHQPKKCKNEAKFVELSVGLEKHYWDNERSRMH